MTTINWKTQIYGKLQLHNVASLLYYTLYMLNISTGGCTSYCIVCTYLHNIQLLFHSKQYFLVFTNTITLLKKCWNSQKLGPNLLLLELKYVH